MNTVAPIEKRRGIPGWLLPGLGYCLAALALYWVFSKFPFAELIVHLRSLDWWWVSLAIVVDTLVYFLEAWRWKVLLRRVGAPKFWNCLQAVFVGLFVNDILPARTGEVIRCFLLSYKTEVPISLALTSDFIMRIMDGVWVVVIYLLVTYEIGSHVAVNGVMWVFALIVLPVAALILLVLFHRQKAHYFVSQEGVGARFKSLLEQLHRLGDWGDLGLSMGIGGLYWAFQIMAIWAIARADGFYFSGFDMAYLAVVKTVGTVIPNAPANVGVFQAAIMRGLEPSLTEPDEAKILAQIIFAFLTLPLILGGAIATLSAGFNLGELKRRAHAAHAESSATGTAL